MATGMATGKRMVMGGYGVTRGAAEYGCNARDRRDLGPPLREGAMVGCRVCVAVRLAYRCDARVRVHHVCV